MMPSTARCVCYAATPGSRSGRRVRPRSVRPRGMCSSCQRWVGEEDLYVAMAELGGGAGETAAAAMSGRWTVRSLPLRDHSRASSALRTITARLVG